MGVEFLVGYTTVFDEQEEKRTLLKCSSICWDLVEADARSSTFVLVQDLQDVTPREVQGNKSFRR